MPLTDQDFIDFYNDMQAQGTAQTGNPYVCRLCGNQWFQMNVNYNRQPAELAVMIAPPPGIVQSGAHHFVSYSCTNCGKTDFFALAYIQLWKHRQGRP